MVVHRMVGQRVHTVLKIGPGYASEAEAMLATGAGPCHGMPCGRLVCRLGGVYDVRTSRMITS